MSDSTPKSELRVGTYRHNKTGNLYEVTGVALDTETNQILVVYKPLYSHKYGYELFTRPYEMFIEVVKLNGQLMPRFEKIED